ncbi:MAG TPA: RodZ domain-containing protein [Bacillota bacterium]|nr:RodZ domain-containing protein [Bacillota bacterium]
MGQVGEILRRAREEKGLTLQQVEDETNMRWKYIEALELENYDIIPGKAYVRGFLRNYAAFLELDPEEILEKYRLSTEIAKPVETVEEKAKPSRPKAGTDRSRGGTASAAIAVLVVAAALGGWWYFTSTKKPVETPPGVSENPPLSSNKPEPQPTTPVPQPSPKPAQPPVNNPTPPSTPNNTGAVNLTLKASGGQCWLNVTSDGVTSFQGFLNNGQAKSFSAKQKIHVRFGNAGVVEIVQNGNSLGKAGRVGMVVDRDFTK